MPKFYYPNGELIEKRENFIDFYSKVYYYLNADIALEKEMEEILERSGGLTKDNIVDIFRWKIGATNYNRNKLIVESQYLQGENAISLMPVWDLVDDWQSDGTDKKLQENPDSEETDKTAEDVFAKLIKCPDIGPVYAITLLYFLSKGTYPIYDKFADLALKAITEDTYGFTEEGNLKDLIPYSDLKDLISKEELKAIRENEKKNDAKEMFLAYKRYISLLQTVLENDYSEYKTNRDYDRALWVYGHLFNQTETNKKRLGPENSPDSKGNPDTY